MGDTTHGDSANDNGKLPTHFAPLFKGGLRSFRFRDNLVYLPQTIHRNSLLFLDPVDTERLQDH